MTPDHYGVLGLTRPASVAEVRRAHRRAVRAAHPDRGGTVERFQAVQEALRVLSDPDLRDAYHRELGAAGPSWSDIGWGSDPDASARPEGGSPAPPQRPAAADGAGVERGPLDPFVGGPRDLPDPLVEPTFTPPGVPAARHETLASAGALTFALLAAVLLGTAFAQLPMPDEQPVSEYLGVVLFGGGAVALNTMQGGRNRLAFWLVTVLGVTSPQLLLGPAASPSGLHVAAAVCAVAAIVVGLGWSRAFRRRHRDPRVLALIGLRDPAWRVERHRRAAAWNEVRRLAEDPTTKAVVLGPPDPEMPGHRWAYDPVGATHAVRPVGQDLPVGSWLVLDRRGTVLATAPHGAPEAWFEILAEARAAVGRR